MNFTGRPRLLARVAGVCYLTIVASAVFAHTYIYCVPPMPGVRPPT